jgi:hypothetical protein
VPAKEKVNRVMSGRAAGPASFSALRDRWKTIFGNEDRQAMAHRSFQVRASHGQDIEKRNTSPELHPLIDVLGALHRRILTNTFLRGWLRWWNWILLGLILAALFSTKLAGAEILAAILIVVGAAVVIAWARRTRPSTYEAACQLDLAAGLRDRISTALYFGEDARPGGLILRQRQDALERLPRLDLRSLFPIRMPAGAVRRTLALAVAVAALFTYRLYYRPPAMALLETATGSRLVRSILSPLKQGVESGLERAAALVNQNAEATGGEKRPAEAVPSSDDLWPPAKPATAGQDDAHIASGDASQQDGSAPGASRPSLNQALLDALKAMFANQPPPSGGNPQGARPDAQQSNNLGPANPSDPGDQRDSQQGPDSQQKNPQGTASGAGDQQAGSKELKKNTPLSVKAVPDRVPLQSTNLKDQPKVDASAEAGTAKIAVGNALPQPTTGVNGAEQENIPERYRSYVQRYFEHADNGRESGQP